MSYDSASASGIQNAADDTFGTVMSDIAEEFGLHLDPHKVAFCGRRFRDSIDDLNRKKLWRFNLIASEDINTVPGEETIQMPSDLWRIYSTRKQDSIDYRLDNVQQDTMDTVFQTQNQIRGYPYVAANFNIYRDGTIRLFPTPDAIYTIRLRYFRLIPKPVSPKDMIDMPRPYQQVPKYAAMAKVASFIGNRSAMQFWVSAFQDAYDDMNRSDEDLGDEVLRFINIEEIVAHFDMNPSVRPRMYDFY